MKSIIKNRLFKKGMLVMSLAALMVVSSCKKFTELSPLSQLSESTAFSNPANIELAMNGVYNRAAVVITMADQGVVILSGLLQFSSQK
jgi:hypothetical protein